MAEGYWKRASRRAATATNVALGIETWDKAVIKGLVAFGAVGALWFFGSADASRDETITRIAIFGSLLAIYPLLFLWKLGHMPAIMEREQDQAFRARFDAIELEQRQLREDIKPRIVFSDDIDTEGVEDPVRAWLTVQNGGNEILQKCSVKVEYVTRQGQPKKEYQHAVKTEARMSDPSVGRFALSPDERKRLCVMSRELVQPRRWFILTEQGGIFFNPGERAAIQFIAAADIGPPDRIVLLVGISDENLIELRLERLIST
jgi:hypothetical protein